jgi:aminoglycoside 3-N-acetyltransferase
MNTNWKQKTINAIMTTQQLERILIGLGVKKTDSCLVHTSLSSFGFIPGGEQSIIAALKAVLSTGDLVMPAQTADLSDPKTWEYPPAAARVADRIKYSMPAFDPKTTPIHLIGKTPEYFRTLHGTYRSSHPLYSFCAWGKHARAICACQPFDLPFGNGSPLAFLYQSMGKVIFLGTDYKSCTALHLAESLVFAPTITEEAPIKENNRTVWKKFKNVALEKYADFNQLGAAFEKQQPAAFKTAPIFNGEIKVISLKELVDFAIKYYQNKEKAANQKC